jgi:hypothetical protein
MTAAWCKRLFLVGATVSLASGLCVMAQQGGGTPPPPPKGGAPGQGDHRPKPPIELVLDANGDGVIDAAEIANAPVALKKLDKNGDGKLTADEYRPPHPPRQDGQVPGAQGPAGGPGR